MSTQSYKGTIRRYSDAFKRQVVEAIEQEGYTHPQAALRYGCSEASIHRWVKRYGKNHLLNKIVRIQTMDEADRIAELTEQVNKLKTALADTHLDQAMAESYFELACKRLGVDPEAFKKKHGDP